MDRSDRFGLMILNNPTDRLDLEDWKFGVGDRKLLDAVLHIAEQHRHSGLVLSNAAPDAPSIELSSGVAGVVPPGSTVYYRYGYVDDRGLEQTASNLGVFHTPPQVVNPGAPILSVGTGGTLAAGSYSYAISAYRGANTLETLLSPTQATIVPTSTGAVTLTLGVPPSGADGFCIYRRAPMESEFHYLTATTGATYLDDGSVTPDSFRKAPKANTTNTRNTLAITMPAAPAGYTYRLYRTYDPTNWASSLLEWGNSATVYDTGHSTKAGSPSPSNATIGSPSKVDLGDVAEVQGYLPPGRNVVPETINFTFDGLVSAGTGEWPFVCEWDHCEIIGLRAALGRGYSPSAQDVIVTIEKMASGETTWNECIDAGETAHVPVGDQIGALSAVTPGLAATPAVFTLGDAMRMKILQSGGGATPNDYNLTVSALVLVSSESTGTSYTWETI